MGGMKSGVLRMRTSNYDVYHLLSITLSAKHYSMSVHRSVHDLEFHQIISRLEPISEAGGILGRDVVGCPSNAHPQLWCLSAQFHHL